MMPQNILILGLGDRCVNVVVEGGLPVREAKARICSLEVSNHQREFKLVSFSEADSSPGCPDKLVLSDPQWLSVGGIWCH